MNPKNTKNFLSQAPLNLNLDVSVLLWMVRHCSQPCQETGVEKKWQHRKLNEENEAANLCPQCTFFDSFQNADRASYWSCTNGLPPVCKVAYPSIAHAPATNRGFLKYECIIKQQEQ